MIVLRLVSVAVCRVGALAGCDLLRCVRSTSRLMLTLFRSAGRISVVEFLSMLIMIPICCRLSEVFECGTFLAPIE